MPPSALRPVPPWRRVAAASVIAVVLSIAPNAHAFERQWHLGIGGGAVALSDAYQSGGALQLHAAYGLSDVFDARFDLRASGHDASAGGDQRWLTFGTLGIAYKLDIIEWVPYAGVRAGYYRFSDQPLEPYAKGGGLIGTVAGIDYAFSRDFALGAEITYETLLPVGATSSFVLHAEYRWGY